ncbi:unnamed protein product, partial [Staurois parvus]
MQAGHRTKHLGQNVCEMVLIHEFSECHFYNFQISRQFRPPYVPTSQGTEPRRQMPASAGGHYRGHCRGD